jgi:hypothetical protein
MKWDRVSQERRRNATKKRLEAKAKDEPERVTVVCFNANTPHKLQQARGPSPAPLSNKCN